MYMQKNFDLAQSLCELINSFENRALNIDGDFCQFFM